MCPGQPQFSASHTGSALLPSFVSEIIKWKWVGTQWTVETYKWSYVHGGLTLKPSPMNSWTGCDLAVCRVLKLGTIYPPISSQGLPSKGGFQQHMLKQEVELGGEQVRLLCKALLLYDLWRQLCTITGAQLLINPNFPNYLALKVLIFHCCRFVPLTHAWKQGGEKLPSWDWKKNIWKSKGQGRVVRREDMRGKGEGKHSSRWWETAGSALPWSLASLFSSLPGKSSGWGREARVFETLWTLAWGSVFGLWEDHKSSKNNIVTRGTDSEWGLEFKSVWTQSLHSKPSLLFDLSRHCNFYEVCPKGGYEFSKSFHLCLPVKRSEFWNHKPVCI